MTMRIELTREDDARWIAEVPDIPGVLVYAATRQEALCNAIRLAFEVVSDRNKAEP